MWRSSINSTLEVVRLDGGNGPVNRTEEIKKKCAGKYQDGLGVLIPSEESRVL